MKLTMNPGFEDEIGKQLNAAVNGAIGKVKESHWGEPVSTVRTALDAALKEAWPPGLNLGDEMLDGLAEKISEKTL